MHTCPRSRRGRVAGVAATALVLTSPLAACGATHGAATSSSGTPAIQVAAASTSGRTGNPPVQPAGTDPSAALPTIESFRTTPTDQFVVDYPLVASGFPYKGRRAVTPHQGAHVNFEQDYRQWPRGGTAPSNYPPIYAVADGVVDRVTASFDNGATDRYGVNVTIARDGATNWDFEYSIEPMVKEPQAGFYAKFIAVHQGQRVHKGQIIAYMYLPPTPDNSHIHFELINDSDNAFAAPAIFSPEVVRQFSQRWGTQGYDSRSGTTNPIPPCMGWKLAADENPFGSGPLDHL